MGRAAPSRRTPAAKRRLIYLFDGQIFKRGGTARCHEQMPQREEGRNLSGTGARTDADVSLQSSRLRLVNRHRMPQRATLARLLQGQENFFASL